MCYRHRLLRAEPIVGGAQCRSVVPVPDPVGTGLVASLSHPGGTLTGVTILAVGLNSKGLELLQELVPESTRLDALVDPTNPSTPSERAELEPAAMHASAAAKDVFCDMPVER